MTSRDLVGSVVMVNLPAWGHTCWLSLIQTHLGAGLPVSESRRGLKKYGECTTYVPNHSSYGDWWRVMESLKVVESYGDFASYSSLMGSSFFD